MFTMCWCKSKYQVEEQVTEYYDPLTTRYKHSLKFRHVLAELELYFVLRELLQNTFINS